MRGYQTAITIGDLKDFIKDLPNDSHLMIHITDYLGDIHIVEKLQYHRESSISNRELIFTLGEKVEY